MIIELKLTGSLRQRKDGLYEFRHQLFGSTYGRTEEEIREKLLKKMQAEKSYLAKAKKKQKSVLPSTPKTPLFSDFYKKEYLPYKYKSRKRLAPSTVQGYENNVKFIKKINYDKPLAEYTSSDVEEFLYNIPQTRKRQIMQGFLNNVFNRAVVKRIITLNPCEAIEAMQHNTQEGSALEFIEQRAFFETLFSSKLKIVHKYYLIFVFLTGCRRNEALYLLKENVDFDRKMIHISGTKTDGSDRYIPLFPLVEKLLKKINPVRERFFNFSCKIADDIFRACIKNHKLHDLRHSFGTIQYSCNAIDVKTLSLWLGHSNISTTLDIYTHPEQLDRAVFLRGDLTPEEKKAILKAEYEEILSMIKDFLG